MKNKNGFTLIENLVVITIIGIIMSLVLVNLSGVRKKARDLKRKTDISQIGKLISTSCYVPTAGMGEYDLMELLNEIKVQYPQQASYLNQILRDPKSGTDTDTFYFYKVADTANGTKCVLYANFENENENITLSITEPTPGGGLGVFEALENGWNGSSK